MGGGGKGRRGEGEKERGGVALKWIYAKSIFLNDDYELPYFSL
jgi:hypothetical protein